MRIALLPSSYFPDIGGVEELTRNLAHTLVEQGHRVEVWTGSAEKGRPSKEDLAGVRIRRFAFPLPRREAAFMRQWPNAARESFRGLSKACSDFQPDVLHVQCFSSQAVYATMLSWKTKIPLVLTFQGETVMDDHDIFERSTSLRASIRISAHIAAAMTGCSQFVLDDLRRMRVKKPGVVVPNGVATPAGTEAVASSTDARQTILAYGRLVPKKGFDLLLAAFAIVAASNDRAHLLLGGSGRSEELLASQVEQLGLRSRVTFLGRLDRDAVTRAFTMADVFCMPSRVEPFGIVGLEAWAHGVPVVATCHGGANTYIVDGHNGLLVDPLDAVETAAALLRILDKPAYAATLVSAANEDIVRYSWTSITQQYLTIYRQVTSPSLRTMASN